MAVSIPYVTTTTPKKTHLSLKLILKALAYIYAKVFHVRFKKKKKSHHSLSNKFREGTYSTHLLHIVLSHKP